MPSSSLFLRSSATLISILSLFSAPTAAAQVYKNVNTYKGADFYDGFNFFTAADPNHGFVNYLGQSAAVNAGLTKVTSGGAFHMGVDSDNVYDPNSPYWGNNGYGRPSVRLESKATFTKGLFIIDVLHMPGQACGIWPAFWTTVAADTWPVGGEIDIVESISNRVSSMAVLHSDGGVISSDASTMTGTIQTTNCTYDINTGAGAAGCAIANTDQSAYGTGLNNAGGRIFAMEWTDATIKIWSFARGSAPADLTSGNPDPSKWGKPVQNFAGDSANIKSKFYNHKIVLNTNFCGDFGDAVWTGEQCAAQTGYSTCASFVANNPAAFTQQYWEIDSLKVYKQMDAPVTTTSTSTSSTTTSSKTSSTTSSTTTKSSSTTLSTTSSSTTSASTSSSSLTSSSTTSASSSSTTSKSTTWTTSRSTTWTTSVSSSSTTSASTGSTSSNTESTTTTWTRPTGGYFNHTTTSYSFDTTSSTPTHSFPFDTTTTTSDTWTYTTSGSTSSTSSISTSCTTLPVVISATGFPGFAQGGSQQTRQWGDWSVPDPTPSFIKTTITTTYFVPCSTGLETSTVTIVTSFAGGKKVTYTPTAAVTTYTTDCPPEWGFGGPVTVTVPITTTRTIVSVTTPTGSGNGNGDGSGNGNGWGNGSGSGSGSSDDNNSGYGNGNGSGSNNGYGAGNASGSGSGTVSIKPWTGAPTATPAGVTKGSSTTTFVLATPDATYKDPAATGTGAGASPSASARASGAVNWSAWSNSGVTDPIAVYKGAASRVGGSVAAIVVAAVMSVLMM